MDENESVVGTLPPPRKEDVLFRPADSAEDWQANAYIAQWEADWTYSNGFRRAAYHLTKKVCDTAYEQDIL
jgi:hypothetical protein